MSFALRIGQKCELGNYRENNEDRVLVEQVRENEQCQMVACLVADGMGGQLAGEKASEMASQIIWSQLSSRYRQVQNVEHVRQLIRDAVLRANDEIIEMSQLDRQYSNMGTTVVLALWLPPFRDDCLFISWLGDSRAYRVRDGKIEALTVDHSVAQALVDAGVISAEEARVHRFRNRLWKYLGTKEVADGPDVKVDYLRPGDRYLLCTDGLTGVVEDERLAQVVSEHNDPQQGAEALVQLALDCDSKDNVSCVLVYIDEAPYADVKILSQSS